MKLTSKSFQSECAYAQFVFSEMAWKDPGKNEEPTWVVVSVSVPTGRNGKDQSISFFKRCFIYCQLSISSLYGFEATIYRLLKSLDSTLDRVSTKWSQSDWSISWFGSSVSPWVISRSLWHSCCTWASIFSVCLDCRRWRFPTFLLRLCVFFERTWQFSNLATEEHLILFRSAESRKAWETLLCAWSRDSVIQEFSVLSKNRCPAVRMLSRMFRMSIPLFFLDFKEQ